MPVCYRHARVFSPPSCETQTVRSRAFSSPRRYFVEPATGRTTRAVLGAAISKQVAAAAAAGLAQQQQKQQQPLPHQQRHLSMAGNRNGPASFPGLLELQIKDNNICSSDGTTIIKNLGSRVTRSPGQQSNAVLQAATAASTTPSTPGLLLGLSSSTAAAAESAVTLGEVCGSAFLACARIKLCWMSPYHSNSIAGLPGHIQFMLVQLDPPSAPAAAAAAGAAAAGADSTVANSGSGASSEAGSGFAPLYATILPLLPDGCKATLQPSKDQPASGNVLSVHFDSGNPDVACSSWQQAVYIAAGSDPYALVDASVAAAAAIAGGARPRWEKQVPDICSNLGWCTWDAFYHGVSGLGIQQGLEGFRAADPARVPRWLIIDDGWQRTGLDGVIPPQQQQQPRQLTQQQQQQRPAAGSGPHSYPLSDAAIAGNSSSNSSYRSSAWLFKRVKQLLHGCQRAVLNGVAAAADRLNWWSLLLSGLRTPLLSGVLIGCLKAFNIATSEHSKRLLSPEFNAKFSNLTIGPYPDTSSTATAADVAAAIAAIKQRYQLKHTYAWHAILGYWSGVSPHATPAAAAAGFGAASDMLAAPAAATAAAAAAGGGGGRVSDVGSEADAAAAAVAAAAAAEDLAAAAAAAGIAAGVGKASSSSGMASSIVLPRVSAAMTDLEPPCNWSQLVLAGIGLPRDPGAFYQQLHSYLASLGIDGVKVDVQNQLELAGSAAGQAGGQALAAAWHAALEASACQHFPGNQLIHCMCHNTNNLYHMRNTNLARVSDDFYPRLPASHTPHVAVCAFNSLFMGVLVTPDWDMFHSLHPRALLHATARMISGGPVYVSDKPGAHDPTLLARLALPGGSLLQPLLPGRPTRDCLFIDPCRDGSSVLKVWNRNSCNGVVAAFNLQGSSWSRSKLKFVTHDSSPPPLSTRIAPGDVEGLQQCLPGGCLSSSSMTSQHLEESAAAAAAAVAAGPVVGHSGEFVLYLDSSKDLTVIQGAGKHSKRHSSLQSTLEGVTVQLPAAGSDVVTVAPVLELQISSSSSSSSVKVAVIGVTNMLNPGGAVKNVSAGSSIISSSSSRSNRAAGSDGGSSSHSSDSWVVAEGDELAAAAAAAAAGTGTRHNGTAKDAAGTSAAAGDAGAGAVLNVSLLGCGQLLVYASCSPTAVLLDGRPVTFVFDSSSCSLVVDVPEPIGGSAQQIETRDLQHSIVLRFG